MRAAPPSPGELVIERARLSGRGGRGALEAALAYVRIGEVAGGEEILVVPRLRSRQPLSALRSPSDFGTRLTDQLRALRAGAQIDPHGPVPGAAALRFTSKARYAAWLVGLWLGGVPASAAGPSAAGPEPSEIRRWLAREVLSEGPVLVAMAGRLRVRRLLGPWLARLTPPELALAERALERAYAVPSVGAARAAPFKPPMAPARLVAPRADGRSAIPPGIDGDDRTMRLLAATWAELAAENAVPVSLEPRQARLALSLAVLARQPNLGRRLSPAVLDRARAALPLAVTDPLAGHRAQAAPSHALARKGRATGAPERPAGSLPKPRQASVAPEVRAPPVACPASRRSGRPPQTPAPTVHSGIRLQTEPTVHSGLQRLAERASTPRPEAPVAGFGTEFGGVLFLVNALLALGLYPDFTRPAEKGLGPSPFWLIDRLALRLFGRDYRIDPLHRWLAAIGLPGALPAAWEVDPRWLDRLPAAPHGIRRSRTRTILWDWRGFALVDAPAALGRTRRYRRHGTAVRGPLPPRRRMPRDPAARWIACLAEFLGARLALAGLDAAALRLPGRVTADEERVEITFDLARLPIELRLAGLDRNPGWLPAEGRSVLFRFE